MGLFSFIGDALFGGSKKTTSSTTSGTTNVQPYAPTIPYLNDYLGQTANLYGANGAPQFSPMEQQGYDALENLVGSGSGSTGAAIAANNKTLNGDYLSPDTNPYLKDIATRVAGIAGATNNATFGGKGRTGSGLAGYYAGQGVGDSLTNLYGQNYANERSNMMTAAGQAPALDASQYLGPQALISAGQNISARPYDINQQYGGILSQIAGLGQQGQTTGEQQNYRQSAGLIPTIANSFTNKLFG